MTRVQFPVVSGQTIQVRVGAQNDVGFQSDMSAVQSIIINPSSTAPGVPTGFTISSTALSIVVSYVNPSNKDLRGVELWWSTSASGTYALYDTMGGVPGEESKFNLNWGDVVNGITFVLGTSYYFKLRAVSTSGVTSSYTVNSSGVYGTVDTGQVTVNAITTVHTDSITSTSAQLSSTGGSMPYSNGTTYNGTWIAQITLGTIPSSVAGFLIDATCMANKRTVATNTYAYCLVVQKVAGNNYWELAKGGSNFSAFLGTDDTTGGSTTSGFQGTYSASFTDNASDVVGTTGSMYGIFVWEVTETTGQYNVFGGSGISVTELKR